MSRAFSKLEKKIIKSLLDLDEKDGLNFIGNIVGEYFPDIFFIQVDSEEEVTLMLKEAHLCLVDMKAIDGDVSDFFITLLMLFDFLKNERYIYFTGKYNCDSLGVKFAGEKYVSCDIIDDDIKVLVYRYTTQKFFITESFKDFVRNGYKTKEEVAKEKELNLSSKELNYTRLALVVTFVGLIASVLVPLLSTTSVKLENDMINTSTSNATIEYIDSRLNDHVAVNNDMAKKTNQSISVLNAKIENALNSIKNISDFDIKVIKDDLKKIKSEVSETNFIVSEIVQKKQVKKEKDT